MDRNWIKHILALFDECNLTPKARLQNPEDLYNGDS